MNESSKEEVKKECGNCKVSRTLDNFIGVKGQEVKTCLKCRNKVKETLSRKGGESKARTQTRKELPEEYNFDKEKIPLYCYYIKATKAKGDGFACDKKHPKQRDLGKAWKTSLSKKIGIDAKFNQLMKYLEE